MSENPTDLEQLGRLVARGFEREPRMQASLAAARAGLMRRARRAPRPEPKPWFGWAGSLAVVASAAFALWCLRAPVRPGASGPIAAVRESPELLAFSEGTRFELEPGTAAHAGRMGPHGGDILLEHGALRASVVHRARSEWHVLAGPIDVRVTGTRFVTQWSPLTGRFLVELMEGAVMVRGPSFPQGRAVQAGERLVVEVGTGMVELHRVDVSPLAPPERAPASASASTPAPPRPNFSRDSSANAGTANRHSGSEELTWQELAAASRYPEALEAVKRKGFSRQCQTLPAGDLLLLADVARFSHDGEGAERALTALRRRFPRSPEAASAAFTLGELSFDSDHAYSQAEAWFSTYLSESPGGALAQEAVGRLVETAQRAGDPEGAEAWGRKYLERYPQGPHADLARRAVGAP